MLWRETNPVLHAIFMVGLGFSAFSCSDTIAKFLAQNYNVHQILASGGFFGIVSSGLWILRRQGSKAFISPRFKWHIAYSIFIAVMTLCAINAFSRMPLADFYAIIFLTPLAVIILSSFILKEKVGWHRSMAVLTGFSGVLIVSGPQFNIVNAGILFAFLAVFFASFSTILLRKAGHMKEDLPFLIFYPSLFNFLLNTPFTIPFDMPDISTTPLFFLFGLLACSGQLLVAIGFIRAQETAQVAPFHYIQMLWGVGFGYVLFGDLPSVTTLAGSALIISSGLYLIWREHKSHLQKNI